MLGRLPEFTARAMFAKNFYEAGGIEAASHDGFKDQAAMVAAFKASGAKLACLCSSDKVYAEQAVDAAKALAAAGASCTWPGGRAIWKRYCRKPVLKPSYLWAATWFRPCGPPMVF